MARYRLFVWKSFLMRVFPNMLVFFAAAISLLLIPLPWITAWFIAVFIHELGHYIALKICRIPIYHLGMKLTGLYMETAPMSRGQELVCSLAGPLLGSSLLLLSHYFPRVAICSFVQTFYNLLPLYPLDGGRGVRCLLLLLCGDDKSAQIERLIRYICYGALIVLGGVATFVWKIGIMPSLIVLGILYRNWNLKTPCKEAEQIVQ